MNNLKHLITLAIFIIGFIGGLRWDAASVQAAQKENALLKKHYAEQVATQKEKEIDRYLEKEAALQQQEEHHGKTLQTLQANADRLTDRLQRERVRVCTAPKVPATPTATGQHDDTTTGTEFFTTLGVNLVRLARDADQVAEALSQCQAYVKTVQGKT